MTKFFYTVLLFLFSFSVINAEIKLIQIKVQDAVDPQSLYNPSKMYDEFSYDDQTSYLLPVKNKRIEGYRMPFIKNFGHDVLLVGPFLDMCGDIQILDADNRVKATIRPASFVSKGRRNYWFVKEWKARKEGYVHFRISKSVLNSITTPNFKIKVGPIDALDIVDCKIAERFQIQGILFTSNPAPQREMTTDRTFRTVKNTFDPNIEYNVKIKLNGGTLASDKFGFVSIGNTKNLLYNFALQSVNSSTCVGNLILVNNPVRSKLIENNDAIEFKVKVQTNSERSRRSEQHGYMIGLRDGNIGTLTGIALNEGGSPRFGESVSKFQKPDGWGPYIYARLMNDIYTFGQYTDLGKIQAGTCNRNFSGGSGGVGGGVRLVGGGGGGSTIPNTNDASDINLSFQNALIYEQNDAGFDDEFQGVTNVCRQAGDPNPKVTTIPNLRAVVTGPVDANYVGNLEIRIKRNGNQLTSGTITNLNAGETKFVEYRRPESRLCTTNPPSNAAICKRCGDGISGIRHWDDENIEIELYANGAFITSITIPSED
jgi:hypothetical protein